jgi:hypothetical protein
LTVSPSYVYGKETPAHAEAPPPTTDMVTEGVE